MCVSGNVAICVFPAFSSKESLCVGVSLVSGVEDVTIKEIIVSTVPQVLLSPFPAGEGRFCVCLLHTHTHTRVCEIHLLSARGHIDDSASRPKCIQTSTTCFRDNFAGQCSNK